MLFSEHDIAKESILGDHNPSEIVSDVFENEDEEDISKILLNHPEVIEGTIVSKNRSV